MALLELSVGSDALIVLRVKKRCFSQSKIRVQLVEKGDQMLGTKAIDVCSRRFRF